MKISRCCGMPIEICGDDYDGTYYFVCTGCKEPCDILNAPLMSDTQRRHYAKNRRKEKRRLERGRHATL